MGHLLRRALWLLPTLFVVAVTAFAALTSVAPVHHGDGLGPELPKFFNPRPGNVQAHVQRVVQTVAAGSPEASRAAAKELARLGGASLPYVIPTLDSLAPTGRARVALALAPVARRMQAGDPQVLLNAESAVSFWNRYWQDHSIDFRRPVVERAVRRMARKSSALRRLELVQLDTYALPDIIREIQRVQASADIGQSREFASLAAHITEKTWEIPEGASLAEARIIASRWNDWWNQVGAAYVAYRGPRRIAAMLLQTQFGTWISHAVRGDFGTLDDGQQAWKEFSIRLPISLSVAALALALGTLIGMSLGAWSAYCGHWLNFVVGLVCAVIAGLPAVVLVSIVDNEESRASALCCLSLSLGIAALVSRIQYAASRAALTEPWVRFDRSLGATPLSIAWSAFRRSNHAVLTSVAPRLPFLITALMVAEHAFGLDGIGHRTVSAIANRETSWLMLVTLASATGISFLQIVCDLAIRASNPYRSRSIAGLTGNAS
ncbi:MAG: ABC transporter permease subunit [Polyangiaceae bacterium]|nr:ABC transporter permease subunit [Polyangiaceae bacterium]